MDNYSGINIYENGDNFPQNIFAEMEEVVELRGNDPLTEQELKAVFDVVNVYEPEDISHVYPEMASDEFMEDIKSAWRKILKSLDNTEQN